MRENEMDYTLQSYFKLLCNGAAIARKEEKRIKKLKDELRAKGEEKAAIKLQFENLFWSGRLRRISNEIEETIDEIKKRDFSIIVTSEEEVLVFMEYYIKHSFDTYPIINTDEMYLKSFPKGKMCKEFLDAYFEMRIADIAGTDSGIEQMKEVIEKYL